MQRCYEQGCADLVDATAARNRTTDLRIGASLVQFSHASRLWSPLLACALRYGVLPDLADLQRHATSTELRLPVPVGTPVDGPLPQRLYRSVITEHRAAGRRLAGQDGTTVAVRQRRCRSGGGGP